MLSEAHVDHHSSDAMGMASASGVRHGQEVGRGMWAWSPTVPASSTGPGPSIHPGRRWLVRDARIAAITMGPSIRFSHKVRDSIMVT